MHELKGININAETGDITEYSFFIDDDGDISGMPDFSEVIEC